jgi:hypothetical protein
MRTQFGTFDGLDNRKAIMHLLDRLGDGRSLEEGAQRRATFLRSLIRDSQSRGLSGVPMEVTPCDAVGAYHLFVAITGCLYVPIEEAARKLERLVRQG